MTSVDQHVLEWCAGHRTPWATHLAKALMWVGETPAAWLVAIVLGVILAMALDQLVALLAAGAALVVATATTLVLKHVVERPRPPAPWAIVDAVGWSMPSSAAALALAPCVVLLLVPRWSRAARLVATSLVTVFTVLLGCSLVYLGAHWASDVLAGWLVGAAVGCAIGLPARALERTPPQVFGE